MSKLVEKLLEAQKNAMAARPKVGGFPVLAEVLRKAGIKMNRWILPSCQSIYFMSEGTVIQQGTPLINGSFEAPVFQREALIAAIRKDQAGESTFPEFLQATWRAGVISYDADFLQRKVSYFGASGESYVGDYPAV